MPKDRMLIKREVTTYAQVLLDAAKGANNILEVGEQLEQAKVTIQGHPALREALNDETLGSEARSNIIAEVFKDFDPALVKVLAVMADRQDMGLLGRVLEEFNDEAEDALGVVIMDVTTVVELDDELREAIKSKYAAQFGKEVMLREHIDPSLIGGIVLGAHGKRIDASVSTQLERTRVALSSVQTGGER